MDSIILSFSFPTPCLSLPSSLCPFCNRDLFTLHFLLVIIQTVCLPWVCSQLPSVSVLFQEFLQPKHWTVEVTSCGIHGSASGFWSQQPIKPYRASGRKCFWPTGSSIICALPTPNLSFHLLKTSRFLGVHLGWKTVTTWELWQQKPLLASHSLWNKC